MFGKNSGRRLSVSAKVGAVFMTVNVIGLAATAYLSWSDDRTSLISTATETWTKNTRQMAEAAKGGVKWKKVPS